MHVARLSLVDYRNYARAELELGPGATVLVGRNGQGKTNLVEAIGYLSTLGSHRVSGDQPLIRAGTDAAIIRALLAHGDRELLVEVQLNRQGANRAQLNRSPVKTRELPRYAHSVLFAPEDLAHRARRARGYGGDCSTSCWCSALRDSRESWPTTSACSSSATRCSRAPEPAGCRPTGCPRSTSGTNGSWHSAQRSSTSGSRSSPSSPSRSPTRIARSSTPTTSPGLRPVLSIDGADPDDEGVGRAAGAAGLANFDSAGMSIHVLRHRASRRRRPSASRLRCACFDRKSSSAASPSSGRIATTCCCCSTNFPRRATRATASRGRSRSRCASPRQNCCGAIRSTGDPVLVLDDVFAELDRQRRQRLAQAIGGFEQVLVTAAVLEDVPEPLTARIVHIDAGRIVEEGADA